MSPRLAATATPGGTPIAPRRLACDVLIVGSGQAGVPLAARLAEAGKRVVLVEREQLGGTCVNVGCTPTKTMVASARAAHVARGAARLGVCAGPVTVKLPAVVARKDAVVREWREGVRRRLERAGARLTVVRGHARFVGPRRLAVNGAEWEAGTVVINAGARPAEPDIPGITEVPWLDSSRIMSLETVPEHLVVLGGGYIGCEFGQMFARFGAQVTIVNRGPHLVDREDPDVSEALEAALRAEGVTLKLGLAVREVSRQPDGALRVALGDGSTVEGSHLLVAVGRSPNTTMLGCDAAGIALDARGFVKVDDGFATSAPGVYAVGDVTGGPQFTHAAWDDHRILYDILMGRRQGGRGGRLVPYCVFTDPQVARVGLSEREARAAAIPYEVATMPFARIARARELDEPAGLLKVLVDPETERVLGAAIVGIEAGELIHVFATLMAAGAPARVLVDAQAVHPTLAEGLQTLVMRLPRFALA